jgi:hypothetical protein
MSALNRQLPAAPPRPRLLALPVVVACLLAYLGGIMHFTLVQHRTCLAHGEVVHGGGEAHGSALEQASQAPFEDERIARSELAVSAEDEDVHCAHAFFRRGVTLSTSAPWSVPFEQSSEPVSGAPRVEAEPVARLRLAPKSSPPQA